MPMLSLKKKLFTFSKNEKKIKKNVFNFYYYIKRDNYNLEKEEKN